jgi:hypothetical protein
MDRRWLCRVGLMRSDYVEVGPDAYQCEIDNNVDRRSLSRAHSVCQGCPPLTANARRSETSVVSERISLDQQLQSEASKRKCTT